MQKWQGFLMTDIFRRKTSSGVNKSMVNE